MRIVFDTWQFVRVMVRLEETRKQDSGRQALWAAWQADWQKLDQELEALREENFDRFAAAMMDQEVTFDPVDESTVRTVAVLAREVIAALKREWKKAARDARDDLEFEQASMTELAERLEDLAAKAGQSSSGSG